MTRAITYLGFVERVIPFLLVIRARLCSLRRKTAVPYIQ